MQVGMRRMTVTKKITINSEQNSPKNHKQSRCLAHYTVAHEHCGRDALQLSGRRNSLLCILR